MRSLRGATIVFVNNFPGGTLGGHERRLLHVIAGCRDAGMHVHLICLPRSAMEQQGRALDVTVAPYALDRRNLIRTRSRIRKYLKRYAADIVQGTGYRTNVLARLAGGPIPTVVVSTASVEPDAPLKAGESEIIYGLRRLADRLTSARNDATIAVSKAVADQLRKRGVRPDRLHVIHTAVSVRELELAAHAVEPPLALGEGLMRVGMVSRLERVKGPEHFVGMAARIASRRADVGFLLAGEGDEQDRVLAAAERSIPLDRFAFLGYVVPSASVIASLDVLVVPSLSEGLGTVALEAAALGVPVVASNVGGLVESVRHEATGLLVPPGDEEALAAAVEALLDDPERRARMGAAGRRMALDDFDVRTMVEDHLALYRRLVSAR